MKEGIKVKIGEIRKALKINQNLTKETVGETGGYSHKEEEWPIYDSRLEGFEGFGHTFLQSLPNWTNLVDSSKNNTEKILKEYIEKTLTPKGKKQDLCAAEFGGPGSRLFRGFTPLFFRQTVGVCLKDIREEKQKEEDEGRNHSVITGNITDPINTEVLIKVIQKLGANKIDLIISRMVNPLDYINKNPAILDRIFRNWYNILNVNGLMFIQYNYIADLSNTTITTKIENWATAIRDRFPEIDIQVTPTVIRLHKKTGAPEKLPSATQLFRNT
ncbi:hypothetical protein HYW72_01755 [Candidatus Nomurabacteria bacterium]|nr:hypothetical protein [Candidatus Nomurabacteria bacterium]